MILYYATIKTEPPLIVSEIATESLGNFLYEFQMEKGKEQKKGIINYCLKDLNILLLGLLFI